MNSNNIYSYQNRSITDMEGEIWKGFPGFEDYYMLSNLGRIKSLSRQMERNMGGITIKYNTSETIRKQVMENNKGSLLLTFTTNVNCQRRKFRVDYAVYITFRREVNFKKFKIIHIDRNSLNNHIDNLDIVLRKKIKIKSQRIYTDSNLCEYPYQNLLLKDICGEIWKDLPGFEGYIKVSNKGRIKRLASLIEVPNKTAYWKEEHIAQQRIIKYYNKNNVKKNLFFSVKVDNVRRNLNVARAIAETFLKPHDTNKKRYVIQYKDNDPFNLSLENLYIISRSKLAKLHTQMGIITPPDFYKMSEGIQFKMKNCSKMPINKYNLDGQYLCTYNSLTDAAKSEKLSAANISFSTGLAKRMCRGFFWRWSTGDTDPLPQKDIEAYLNRFKDRSIPVKQYSIDGNFIANYRSIEEAARMVKCSPKLITLALRGKIETGKKFFWKYAFDT